MSVESVEGIRLTVSQSQELAYLVKELVEEGLSSADAVAVAEETFLLAHKVEPGPLGNIWADLDVEDDADEMALSGQRKESQ